MNGKYILDDKGNPIPEPDILKWTKWFKKGERHIGDTTIGDVRISTVFLGLDRGFGLERGNPILWETMVFGGNLDGEIKKYTSLKDAQEGHKQMVEIVKESIDNK